MTDAKTPTLAQVLASFHQIFPPQLAESWDASGLILGREERPVSRIGFAVDATSATATEALQEGAGLLITHHPLLLRGASFLPASSYKGNIIHQLIEGGCGLLAAHTNVDSAPYGTNEAFMDLLGISDRQVLAGANSSQIRGQEVQVGIGRVGNFPQPVRLKEIANLIAQFLPATAAGIRVAGRPDQKIQRVAVCTGAGDSLFDAVRAQEADLYITADLRHHPASEAREEALLAQGKPALIDCSHFASEWVGMKSAAGQLQAALAAQGFQVTTYVSTLNTDPWDFTLSTGDTYGSASTR